MNKLKMYILIKDTVDTGHAINSAAHASLMGYLKWRESPEMNEWLSNSFRKVTCKVTEEEFEKAKEYEDHVVVTELAFGKAEVGWYLSREENGHGSLIS